MQLLHLHAGKTRIHVKSISQSINHKCKQVETELLNTENTVECSKDITELDNMLTQLQVLACLKGTSLTWWDGIRKSPEPGAQT